MKIFHLTTSTINSHYYENLCKGLARNGFSIVLGSLTQEKRPSWATDDHNYTFYCLKAEKRSAYPLALYKLKQILKNEKVDILHTHLFDASFLGSLIKKFSKNVKVIVSRHHLDLVHLLGTKIHIEIDRFITKSTDLTLVPSVVTKDFMQEVEHLDADKIRVINYGFDFSYFSAGEAEKEKVLADYGLKDAFVIGCVGHLQENKGQRYLLKAVAKIKNKMPNVKILLLGEPNEDFIRPIINEYDLSDNVIIGGYRNDVAACMKAMNVLVHPSLSESFSQVIVEAMSVGTPVIATPCGIAPEVITDGESGFLIPLKDSEKLSEDLLMIYKNDRLVNEMTERAKSIVREKFTLEKFINSHIDVYKKILNKI